MNACSKITPRHAPYFFSKTPLQSHSVTLITELSSLTAEVCARIKNRNMSWLSFFGTQQENTSVKELYKEGAIVLDVRSPEEFASGHVKNSTNIPLQSLQGKINKIKSWNKPVITCCRSGNRSGMAKNLLEQAGVDCVNGGSWQQVQNQIK